MGNSAEDCRVPLGQYPGQPTLRFDGRAVKFLLTRAHNLRTEEAYPCSLHRVVWKAILVAGILAMAVSKFAVAAGPQKPPKPLTQQEVINLLKGDVPSARIEDLARERGVAFPMTVPVENQLRAAGATDSLLGVLRGAGPRSPSPRHTPADPGRPTEPPTSPPGGSVAAPVLIVQSSPGGATVYLDDEPVGATSATGILKHPRLSAGEHALRVSLAGYQDYQESIELRAGETLRVTAKLIATSPEVSNPPESFRAPEVRPGDAYFPALGIVTPESQPEDYTVIDVLEVAPGSPAERAGLHSACTILSIAGVRVTSPQHLQQVLSQHRAGETVEITFNDGSLVHSERVRLASNTPASGARPSR